MVFDLVGDLYTVPITGGTADAHHVGRCMGFDGQPRFSPDGKSVVYSHRTARAMRICGSSTSTGTIPARSRATRTPITSRQPRRPGTASISSSRATRIPASWAASMISSLLNASSGIEPHRAHAPRPRTAFIIPERAATVRATISARSPSGKDPRYIFDLSVKHGRFQYNQMLSDAWQVGGPDDRVATGKTFVRTTNIGGGMRPTLSRDEAGWLAFASRRDGMRRAQAARPRLGR